MKNQKNNDENKILIVDDEEQFLLSAEFILNAKGFKNIRTANSGKKALQIVDKENISAVLLDFMMPGMTGVEVLKEIKKKYLNLPVIMLTAINEVDTAVMCMRCGAYDYLVKPIDNERLVITIKNAVEAYSIMNENEMMKKLMLDEENIDESNFSDIITRNSKMVSIFKYISAVSKTSLPVLILGETGAGKELIAKSIHKASGRNGRFVAVNISGVDDNLFSDTLFGHRRGAFTGADRDRKGFIEDAAGGTLFLDEIGDLSKESQVKLLRVIQEKTYYPLGSDTPLYTDARIVAATHRNLGDMMKKDLFRSDLYYRLKSHNISVPSLKERKDDIPLLVDNFIKKACEEFGKRKISFPPELITILVNYDFPGNIRELQSLIYDAVGAHGKGMLSLDSFKEKLNLSIDENDITDENLQFEFPDKLPTIDLIDEMLISEALKRSKNNQEVASKILGISRQALNKRLKRKK